MIKPLLLCALIATIVFVSCRKMDLLPVGESSMKLETVVSKFFGLHRSSNPEETAILDFVKRRNEKTHFVEETVKRIGYPRWDKMLKVKTGNAMVIKNNSTTSPNSAATHAGAQSGHPAFNTRVLQKLNQIKIDYPNITPDLARQKLEELINSIRVAIAANPNVHINNLIF